MSNKKRSIDTLKKVRNGIEREILTRTIKKTAFGDLLRSARLAKGECYEETGAAIGRSSLMVQLYESGVSKPSLVVFARIMKHFKLTMKKVMETDEFQNA